MRYSLVLPLLVICTFAGCGAPGAPLPPSLGIPKPVTDLKVARKGNIAALSWTQPSETTDGELIRKTGRITALRSASGGPGPSQWQTISQLPLQPALKQDHPVTQTLNDDVSSLLSSGADFASYSVLAQSNTGRQAGASNQADVPLVPIPATPTHVSAAPVPAGISISWDQAWPPQNPTHLTVQYAYRVMRLEEGARSPATVKDVTAGGQAATLVDTGIEWQKHYQYWVIPVTLWQGHDKKGEVPGDNSEVVSVFANDTFPPAVPEGLQAVFSAGEQPSIDLSWTPDTEPDLAGYNVYRHVEGEAPVKINAELVKASSFRDTGIRPGNRYYYAVSAVDVRGNESGKSAEASEVVPAQ